MLDNRKKSLLDALPMPPDVHWFWGHIPKMGGKDFSPGLKFLMRDYCNEHGQTAFWLKSRLVVSVTHFEDARTVLNQSHSRKPMPMARLHFQQFLGAENILLLNGKQWKFHRNSILRALRPKCVDDARSGIRTVMKTCLSSLSNHQSDNHHQPIDIGAFMKMITMDIFGQTAFHLDFACCRQLKPSPLAIAFDYMGEEMTRRMFHPSSIADFWYWIPTAANLRHQRERRTLRGFLRSLIQDRRNSSHQQLDRPQDLLDSVLQALFQEEQEGETRDHSGEINESTVTDVLISLLFAGYDTTSITLTYALYHIATYPDIERKCKEEIDRSGNDDINADDLVYCKAVIQETLRLYPPAPFTTRTLEHSLTLRGGTVIPAETLVWVPIWLIHRMEEHFDRPLEFLPERWVQKTSNANSTSSTNDGLWEERDYALDTVHLNDSGVRPVNRKAFFAFSAGRRSCAGMQFAMTESVMVLAYLIKHFSFTISPEYELYPIRAGLIQRPRDPMMMTVRKRDE
jgi:cytochrome P450